MKHLPVALLFLLALVAAKAHAAACGGDGTITWDAPSQNTDGTPLINLKGFKPYHGTSPTSLTPVVSLNDPTLRRWTMTCLPPGVHYFALMAYTQTTESELSGVVSTTVAADPPPVCGAAPAVQTRQQACTAPLIGSFTQTSTPVSAPFPTCWTAGPFVPAAAPAGVCASPPPPQLVTVSTTAYTFTKTKDGFVLLPVGSIPIGTPCDSTYAVTKAANTYRVVPKAAVTFSGGAKPDVSFAICAP